MYVSSVYVCVYHITHYNIIVYINSIVKKFKIILCTYILKCTYYILLCTLGNNNGHKTSTIWKKCVFRTNILYIFQVIAVCGYYYITLFYIENSQRYTFSTWSNFYLNVSISYIIYYN